LLKFRRLKMDKNAVSTLKNLERERTIIDKRIETTAKVYSKKFGTSLQEGIEYAIKLSKTWKGFEYLI